MAGKEILASQFSCCCRDSGCKNFEQFNDAFKKLEYDSMLAAEIGQALLKKQKNDSNLSIDDPTTNSADDEDEEITIQFLKNNLHDLKQSQWEKERSKQIVAMLEKEVSSLKLSSMELKKQTDIYKQEAEKKNAIEQMLREKIAQLEKRFKTEVLDLKQELHHAIKKENSLLMRYKKLESNYETLRLTYESLEKEQKLNAVSKSMLESNERIEDEKLDMLTLDTNQDTSRDDLYTVKLSIPNNYHGKDRKVAVCYPSNSMQDNNSICNCIKNPFDVLHSVTREMVDRISATDTRTLNKRLKRGVFNISELSELSNSILEQIVKDLETDFRSKFGWFTDQYQLFGDACFTDNADMTKISSSSGCINNDTFFSLVNLIQFLLKDLSINKMTLNDLQADYVRRIETLTNTTSTSLMPINPIKNNDPHILDPLSHHKLAMTSTVACVRASSPAKHTSRMKFQIDKGRNRRQGLLSFFV
ncbi:hypothetical protein BDF20DRAFT_909522 [Mycotypha africana]|uniref:uncharacterized protein n=1 Tax=Mycotypha africana TaxID=64632 RepID=UPI002300791C|nr:uncharacterized protein BDF20DRAFT_909522 [Mycotypha africana]KAI8991792.1 hypothetical protein BDF20DRAFT_909522 [Mycotypha africana]